MLILMAVGQNQWYHFGVGAPPSLVNFSGDLDVHWGHGLLTHGHMFEKSAKLRVTMSFRLWRSDGFRGSLGIALDIKRPRR